MHTNTRPQAETDTRKSTDANAQHTHMSRKELIGNRTQLAQWTKSIITEKYSRRNEIFVKIICCKGTSDNKVLNGNGSP